MDTPISWHVFGITILRERKRRNQMNMTKKEMALIEHILKGIVLPAKHFCIRMGKRMPEAARLLWLTSPSGLHWMTLLCTLIFLRSGL